MALDRYQPGFAAISLLCLVACQAPTSVTIAASVSKHPSLQSPSVPLPLLVATEKTVTPEVPISYIGLAGAGSLNFTTGTLIVPDFDTTEAAGNGLRHYDAHIAKMVEVTAFWCQGRKADFRVDWNYEAEGGKVFMGQFPLTCQRAQTLMSTYGTGAPASLEIFYRGNSRQELVPTLDLQGAKVKQFSEFVQTLQPQCLDEPNRLCPGDRAPGQ